MTAYPVDRFQGDPKMFMDGDGSYFKFNGGQPIMDGGLENAVLISLFTRPNWFGNALLGSQSSKIGSEFELKCEATITKTSLVDIEIAARQALQWMIDSGIVAELQVGVRNYKGSQLQIAIGIKPPYSEDPLKLLLTKNGANWAAQVLDPAYRR